MNIEELNKDKNYKEYNFTFNRDCCEAADLVNVVAQDFVGNYQEIINNFFEDEDKDDEVTPFGETEETPIDAIYVLEDSIKEDIENHEGKNVKVLELIDYQYDNETMNGTFKIAVNF